MYVSGLVTLEVSLVSQMELALAQLDTTDDNQKRLDYLQAGFNSALLFWRTCPRPELQNVGAEGGEYAATLGKNGTGVQGSCYVAKREGQERILACASFAWGND